MITWREFAEADYAYTRSLSQSSGQSGSFVVGTDTLTTRFSSFTLESQIFSGAFHYSTSSSGSTTSNGFSQTQAAAGSEFTFSTTFRVETSTTETREVASFRTQTTSQEYSYITSTTTTRSEGDETFEDWTTTSETDTKEVITHESYTEQQPAAATTTLGETTAGNYWNTVYQAETNSVFLVAPRVQLADWDGQGQTLSTETRTTISAETSSLPLVVIAASVVAGTASVPPETLTNASSSSSLQWTRNTSYVTEITSANLLALPHSTFVTEVLRNDSTITTSTSDARGQTTLTHRGNTYTRAVTYQVRKTRRQFADTSSFAITFADRSVTTNTLRHEGTFTTQTVSGPNSGRTIAAGGATSTITQIPYCGIRPAGEAPGWILYGRAGASASNGAGLFYPITENLSFVDQAQTRWPAGMVTIFPATNDSYTANATALTWTTTTAGSDSVTTQSSFISVGGQARTTVIGGQMRPVLGGALGEFETAVQTVGRGVYVNQSGETSFFEGNASSYSANQFSETNFWHRLPWLGEVQIFLSEAPRNSEALPAFVDQIEEMYPPDEF